MAGNEEFGACRLNPLQRTRSVATRIAADVGHQYRHLLATKVVELVIEAARHAAIDIAIAPAASIAMPRFITAGSPSLPKRFMALSFLLLRRGCFVAELSRGVGALVKPCYVSGKLSKYCVRAHRRTQMDIVRNITAHPKMHNNRVSRAGTSERRKAEKQTEESRGTAWSVL